ncbi:MAG: PilX N-terminal domain-containing pilus assembly protein, partial [Nitrososphaerales archaeon]
MSSRGKFKTFIIRSVYGNEKGIVLVVALVFLVVLGVMGGAAVVMTRGDLKISGNYKNSETAFYVAEAGIENG